MDKSANRIRHVLGLSGGKDSAALAIYLKQKGTVPEMEYFFSDTGKELPEVYNFLDRMEAYLGCDIKRLSPERDFDHYLTVKGHLLPSPRRRWCTRLLKIKPFEEFIGDDPAVTYVGIRADEGHRKGYISTKPNITAQFPFIDDDIMRADVFRILQDTVGIPEYYEWRSRSGCYFCFFQRKEEWIGLYRNHPDLFEKAMAYEKPYAKNGEGYSWNEGVNLKSIPILAANMDTETCERQKINKRRSWQEILIEDGEDEDPEDQACLICSL